jgi:cellulose synthase/poly-beta-1,6-N-acetylglucosamine synthase-like glycosyltransferase
MRPSLKPTMAATDSRPIAKEPLVSVIIPALDEAESLGQVIAAVRAGDVPCEIMVVDAGSSDDTAKIAAAAGTRVLHSARRQRAFQLNLGAQQGARWDPLVFTCGHYSAAARFAVHRQRADCPAQNMEQWRTKLEKTEILEILLEVPVKSATQIHVMPSGRGA